MNRAAVVAGLALSLASLTCRDAVAPHTAVPESSAIALAPISTSLLDAWSPGPIFPTARLALGAATGADGNVYIAGGYNTSDFCITSAYRLDQQLNAWVAIAPMPVGRRNLGLTRGGDGRLYAIGGETCGSPSMTATVDAYSSPSNSWSSVASLPEPLMAMGAAMGPDGRIYVSGGLPADFNVTKKAWVYTPSTNTWAPIADMTQTRYAHAMVAGPDGRIYAIGGIGAGFAFRLTSVEAYNIATNTWTSVAPLPSGTQWNGAVVGTDQLIYSVAGIHDGVGPNPMFKYNVATNTWSTGVSMPSYRQVHATAVDNGGRIWVMGGQNEFGGVTQTSDWIQTAPPPPSIAVSSSANPSVFGQPVQLTMTFANANPPDGQVVGFLEGSTFLALPTINNGTATATVTLPVGSHDIVGAASGIPNSPAITQVVNKASSSGTLFHTTNPSLFGAEVIYGVTIAAVAPGAGVPTGTVSFSVDGNTYASGVPLNSVGNAFGPILMNLALGDHIIAATYSGSGNFLPVTVQKTHTVGKIPTTTQVGSNTNPSVFGQTTQLNARVIGSTGRLPVNGETVTFFDGANALGTATLNGGDASLSISTLSPGPHAITVSYAGSAVLIASTSAVLTHTVNKAATSATLIHTANPSVVGTTVIYGVDIKAVAPGAGIPTGPVTFSVDGSVIASGVPLDANGRIIGPMIENLAVGNHTITISYAGDTKFLPVSISATHVVAPPPNVAPIANAGGPYTGIEGSAVALNASASSDPDGDPLTYDWNFGDGASSVNGGATPSHTYADNGTYTVTVTVRDDHSHSSTSTSTVTVSNAAPIVAAFAGASIMPGDTYSSSGTVSDAGADTFTGAVSWGDGNSSALSVAGNAYSSSHVYTTPGTYTVTVTITDDDGGIGTRSATVVVLTPAAATQQISTSVTDLLASAAITSQTANQFSSSLDAAVSSLASGNTSAASGQLGAFINKVEAAISNGKISAANGAALIAAAQAVLAGI
jgi:PKD repeat protein/N-acetylneuraminic acid mutarotase